MKRIDIRCDEVEDKELEITYGDNSCIRFTKGSIYFKIIDHFILVHFQCIQIMINIEFITIFNANH